MLGEDNIKKKHKITIEYLESINRLTKAYNTDCGYDIRAHIPDNESPITLKPKEIKTINTGIRINLPENMEAMIRPRSGLASKQGITVLNSPGTIDPNYTGEIKVILINHGDKELLIENGNRIAQITFHKIERPEIIEIFLNEEHKDKNLQKLPDNIGGIETQDTNNHRGTKGFGSSGVE